MKDVSVLDGMKKNAAECLETAYYKGYKKGLSDGMTYGYSDTTIYKDGIDKAWECARKVVGIWAKITDYEELNELFGNANISNIFEMHSGCDAMEIIKDYEDRQKQLQVVADMAKEEKDCRTCNHGNCDECDGITYWKWERDNCKCSILKGACPYPEHSCRTCPLNCEYKKAKKLSQEREGE